jgi:hypothetical protein
VKTVQILGLAPNITRTTTVPDTERWCTGYHRSYKIKWRDALTTYTRWFNLHTARHIRTRYPRGYDWYALQSKPIYLQEVQADIPASITFPRVHIQNNFSINGQPCRYFTCSAVWLIAFAIVEGFACIDLCGFQLKRDRQYDFERPCFFYWVDQARQRGIEVLLPVDLDISLPGNPLLYEGPLYGFEPHNDYYAKTF